MKTLYHSPLGTLVLLSDDEALLGMAFAKTQETVTDEDGFVFAETRRWLNIYFSGKNPDFMPPLKPQGTPFQQMVWRMLLSIPYGKTTTYGDIAQRVGCRSAQAIGQAVHNNPIAIIIPCHRVVGSNGLLTGYAYGLSIKRKLLELEGCDLQTFD